MGKGGRGQCDNSGLLQLGSYNVVHTKLTTEICAHREIAKKKSSAKQKTR